MAEAAEPNWLAPDALLALREELIEEHGPFMSVELAAPAREALLQALDAPRQRWLAAQAVSPGAQAVSPNAQAAPLDELAAVLGVALTRCPSGHPCLALAAVDVFLRLNDRPLTATEGEAVGVFREVALGQFEERQVLNWLRHPGTYLWPLGAGTLPPSWRERRRRVVPQTVDTRREAESSFFGKLPFV